MRCALTVGVGVLLSLSILGCRDEKAPDAEGKLVGAKTPNDKVHVAFVTNQVATFWSYAKAGVKKAEGELKNVTAEFIAPEPRDVSVQRQKIESLLAQGVDGIAVSPIDPASMNGLLKSAASKTVLICHDSDAPDSNRVLYVGTNNFTAGQAAGRAFLEACPEGGKVALFVAQLDTLNAKQRHDGFVDATKGKVTVEKVFLDQGDEAKSLRNAEEALNVYGKDLAGLVGLYAYNGPTIALALRKKIEKDESFRKLKVIAFDEDFPTLDAIDEGLIHATVVQDPFQFGYQSVKILTALARGDKSVLPSDFPKNRIVYIPERIIRKADAAAFKKTCQELLSVK